jgi:hypothetical protein
LGGPGTATPGSDRRASTATPKANSTSTANTPASKGNSSNTTGAHSVAGNISTPEGQPESTKELSQNLGWANLHILTLDAFEYFSCVKQRAVSADLYGTFVLSAAVIICTGLTRWFADSIVMPMLARSRGQEVAPKGYFMFPSWEAIVFEAVSWLPCMLCYVFRDSDVFLRDSDD